MANVDLQVDTGSDDGYEDEGTAAVHLTASIVYSVSHADAASRKWVASRFHGPSLPPNGATISVAYATINVDNASYDDINVDIYAEDGAGPTTLTTATGDITDRTLTTASAPWVADDVGGGWVQSPSLVDVIQELASDYTATAIVLIFKPRSDAYKFIGISQQELIGSVSGVKLHLEWSESPGDVYISGDYIFGSKGKGSPRIVFGSVQLDGTNSTPVSLSGYFSDITESPVHAVVSMEGETSPDLDPASVTSAVSGATINVYAWKVDSKDNCTLVASTDNARLVNWLALGPSV